MNRSFPYCVRQPTIKKKCSRCKKTKPLSEFRENASRKGGRNNKCGECVVKDRQWYEANRESALRRAKEWKKKNREREAARAKRDRMKHPEKAKARNAVAAAVRFGRMPRVASLKCFRCENQARHYHHHKGYAEEHWLDVVPVCGPCHLVLDNSQE